MTTKQTATKTDKRVSVTLAKPHTHAGDRLKPGAQIRVTPEQKTWLEQEGVIQGSGPGGYQPGATEPAADNGKEK